MIDFRIIKSPEPTRVAKLQEQRVIAEVSDLFNSAISLYASTRVLRGEYPDMIVEENKHGLVDKKRWRVNMAYPMDRAGIQQFKSVPFDILVKFWRKPINIRETGLVSKGSGIFKFNNEDYFGRSVSCYFLWNEMGTEPANPSVGFPVLETRSNNTMKWMLEHSPEIILFTDTDTMFLDPATEVAYISDLMG